MRSLLGKHGTPTSKVQPFLCFVRGIVQSLGASICFSTTRRDLKLLGNDGTAHYRTKHNDHHGKKMKMRVLLLFMDFIVNVE